MVASPSLPADNKSSLKGAWSGSRELLKFWEISANISETVLDRDIATMKD